MAKKDQIDSLSIGFIIYIITQTMTFICLFYIFVYYPLTYIFMNKILSKNDLLIMLSDYILPQGYWLVYLPAVLLMSMTYIYMFLPLYNKQNLQKYSESDNIKQFSRMFVDDKSTLYIQKNMDIEMPGVEDLMVHKVNERLYRNKEVDLYNDTNWITKDIYI
ncbi:Phosphatidylinositol N-acetylglucosaminyltransferase subunit HuGPI19 [Hanseniaspora uvarum DSM 2768]|nr:Phosphatidylinositol N-acetylglucosaminyltransferase subunit HuGPI19 [Hanseniaspora uvarum DSM 2768]